jgi:hypothetical protein
MPPCVVKRDAKGRFAGCMPGTGGGSRSGGGKKSGGGGLASQKVDDLQDLAKKEGIDIDALSYKARRSVLVKAIEAKRAGKDLREEGLLKATKSKRQGKTPPKSTTPPKPRSIGKTSVVEKSSEVKKKYKDWEEQFYKLADLPLIEVSNNLIARRKKDRDALDKNFPDYARKKALFDGLIAKEQANLKELQDGLPKPVRDFAAIATPQQLKQITSASWVSGSAVSEGKKLGINDDKGNMQAVLSYSHNQRKGFEIDYLATAPWNLMQTDPRSVKGAGTEAIAAAIKKSQSLGYGGQVTLSALDSAIPFYRKMGFSGTGEERMTLSAKDANSLLSKLGKS